MTQPTNKTLFVAADLAEPRKTSDRKRSRTTTDVTRVKPAYVAGLTGCIGIGVGLLAPLGTSGSSLKTLTEIRGPGPLTPPHAARLTCASCHGNADVGTSSFTEKARGACEDCHGQHRSTRKPHQALRARGELECVTCHTIHGPQSGVRFLPSGETRRYSTWGETVVPGVSFRSDETLLVPTIPEQACMQCHTDAPDDPFARCRTNSAQGKLSPTVCFDEHVFALAEADPKASPKSLKDGKAAKKSSQVCSDQHFADRPFVWEAAREALEVGPPPPATERPVFAPMIGGVLGAALGYVGTALATRRRRTKQPAKAVAPARSQKRLPLINTTTCLGCYACVDACPYGVLDVNRYVAQVVRPDACCGLVLCEQACPNGSLKVAAEGAVETSEFEGPRLALDLESADVPGVFLAGDITGVPLIKSAIAQGVAVANSVAKKLAKPRSDGQIDACVVGAGPAGISAMLRLKELGYRAVALEQGTVAQSIQNFPRGKLVFDQPLDLPVAGALWLRESTKEELLLHWTRIVRKEGLEIREARRMTGLDALGDGRGFIVRARAVGAGPGSEEVADTTTIHARAVVLAIGTRGSPRKLPCPIPEDCEGMVHYHLADARSLAGSKVVIAGLGDVAMETAIALASQPRTQVTIVARAATYSRGQSRNIAEVERLRKAGRLHVEFRCEIKALTRTAVILDAGGLEKRVAADHVFVLIGSIPPWDTLAALGIRRAERQARAGADGRSPAVPKPYPHDAKTLRSET